MHRVRRERKDNPKNPAGIRLSQARLTEGGAAEGVTPCGFPAFHFTSLVLAATAGLAAGPRAQAARDSADMCIQMDR
jgi:hypothetical protein